MMPDTHRPAKAFHPSLLGSWFLFVGLLMGPAIILFDRDPQGRTLLWTVMTVFFLGLILHRLGISYRLDEKALVISRWWGILGETVIPYGEISMVETKRSLASSVAGRGHVLVATGGGAWEAILSQKDPEGLQLELERLRGEAPLPGLDAARADIDVDSSDVLADDDGHTDDNGLADEEGQTDDYGPADDEGQTDGIGPADDESQTDDDGLADDERHTDDDGHASNAEASVRGAEAADGPPEAVPRPEAADPEGPGGLDSGAPDAGVPEAGYGRGAPDNDIEGGSALKAVDGSAEGEA
ncbi:MAG: hypothetical protein LBR80_12860 [Deltaproteobacteria bacterium]|jgi:hypothetical protein|nr:hypothetical protein [Deltaproteobacteria bacterium]